MKNNYSKFILFSILFFLISKSSFSQNSNNIWNQISKEEITQEKIFSKAEASSAVFYTLNFETLKSQLRDAPLRGASFENSNLIIEFPNNQGNLQSYYIKEAPVLGNSLQSQFQSIRSYIGVAIDNPKITIRFSLGQDGFHSATYRTNNGTEFIDPYTKDRNSYIIYATKDLPSIDNDFVCNFESANTIDRSFDSNYVARFNDGNLRTFRLALACTGEYAQFHLTQQGVGSGETDAVKKAAVLSAMNTTMTRVNGVYENELALTMTLVDNTSIIYLDGSTDPYTNNSGSAMLGENQTTIDTNIGAANYDIGHVFSTGGGGVAYLNSPCDPSSKAGGVTGLSSPIGDVFDIDFVSHEMGHQFGANHTFNGDSGSCGGGNRNNPTAFEPGSGSTIMAYAGICSPQNVQNNSDAYFHVASLNEIWTNISVGISTCASLSSTGNNSPTINSLVNYAVPKSTPFVLTGNGNDVDGIGTLTYCWEQKDNAIATMPPVSTSNDGPAFRSIIPSSSMKRSMPEIGAVIGVTSATWEVLPSVARTLNFDLTVRDNDTRGGRYTTESMVVTIEDVAPFLVTEPNIAVIWGVGTTHTISWDVGSTTNGTINCQNVNILLSTDGGLRYPINLASNTPNDGTQDIVIPNNISTTCRIMVEAADNIFYNITNVDFTIAAADGTPENCPSTYSNAGGEYISNITFNTINNNSTEGANGYEDFTGISSDVEINTTYQMNVEINTAGNFTDNCEVYIDWNQDFIFDTSTEKYFMGAVTNMSAGVLSQNITVPSGAAIGNTTMRINIEYNTNPGPCDIDHVTEWGETEDYTLNILNNLGVDDELFKNFNIFPNPNDGNFTISFQSDSSKKVKITLYDVLGRTITNQLFNKNRMDFTQNLHFNNLSQGIYLLKISQENKATSKQLIIKKFI
ncbi:MAG: M12 family metallo-peptidase [Flavobacteriaceae bacterium]